MYGLKQWALEMGGLPHWTQCEKGEIKMKRLLHSGMLLQCVMPFTGKWKAFTHTHTRCKKREKAHSVLVFFPLFSL